MYIVDEISAKTAQKSQKIIAKQDRNNIRSISSEERGQLVTTVVVFVQMKMFFLSATFIHEKANCIAMFWEGCPHSLGNCRFHGVWATCLPHKDGASH